jgi:enediyne biosynthesis protein E4
MASTPTTPTRSEGSAARWFRRALPYLVTGLLLVPVAGSFRQTGAPVPAAPGIRFVDVTPASGIRFTHTNGAFGKKYLPETMGSGCAFLDYDGDGWQDVFLVNSKAWNGPARSVSALYRNDHDGTFTDVTRAAGLDLPLYGMGVAAADYDNDGREDLYVTALDGNHLFHAEGGGRFRDVTARAGVGASGFSTSALLFDYDKDGWLDLFVARYVQWSIAKDLFCTLDGTHKSYCTPESYQGETTLLFRNRGDGTFADVTRQAGLFNPSSKALGAAMLDYDGDGWPDLVVANDTQPNKLYRNGGNGTFTDVGAASGIAFSEAGAARAGMGVDAADYDGSGWPGLIIGNFSHEMLGLYHNQGNGLFVDDALMSPLGRTSFLTLAFGCFFFDYDLDGLPDIYVANGHVADDIGTVQPSVHYAQPPHLFHNLGGRRFEDVAPELGPALRRPLVARGAAHGDFDGDGDPDLLVTTNNGPAYLLRNDGGNRNGWLRVRTVGTVSNRDGIGARVTVTLDDGRRLWGLVRTGSSYLSQSELPLTFGLGPKARVVRLQVAWPSGKIDTVSDLGADRSVEIQEGKGLVSR